MIGWMIVCAGMVSASPSDSPAPAADTRRLYQEAKSAAGSDPESRVRLALWCEAHGMNAERVQHLAEAVLADAAHVKARGLMGLVEFAGKWVAPEKVAESIKNDEARAAALTEYNTRRTPMKDTADDHHALGLWCEKQGLKAEAIAHFMHAVRLDPKRESAWKHLGYKKRNGFWMSDEQYAAFLEEKELQGKADRKWKPLLAKYKTGLASKDKERREEAELKLSEVTDPRAVPAIWSAFATGSPANQEVAAGMFARLQSPIATQALASLAIFGGSPRVREVATTILKQKDAREYLDFFVALVRKRLKYEVKHIGGPGTPGVLFVEGEKYNVRRIYSPDTVIRPVPSRIFVEGIPWTTAPWLAATPVNRLANRGLGTPSQTSPDSDRINEAMAAAQINAIRRDAEIARMNAINEMVMRNDREMARQRLAQDTLAIENINEEIVQVNGRVLPILNEVSGEKFGEEPTAWKSWWTDQKGYGYTRPPENIPKPTFDEIVPLPATQLRGFGTSCFAAGTPVRTIEGPRPIESIRVGDQVLVQETKQGKLHFQPVVAIYHNAPNATLRIGLRDESIVATGIHRFWKAGKGWVMARELKPGDQIRTLGGVSKVVSVKPERVQPVFNLEVAEGRSFFVGGTGALVHDNTLVEATPSPFDAPVLSVASKPGKP